MIGIIIGIIMIVVVGYAIIKGKYAPMVLFASGVIMLLCAVIFETGNFLPKKALNTGNDYLNIVEFVRYAFSNCLAELGLIIMVMVGFASYMTHIGANDAFVSLIIRPLKKVKSPYLMLFFAFLLAKAISMVITSAVGLGVLCLALMGPALIALGINKLSIGAICATSGAASLVLVGASTMASAQATSLTILDYVFIYKIPAGIPTVIVMGLAHVFWQRYLDKKEGWNCNDHIGDSMIFDEEVKRPKINAPMFYALFPFLPMIFVVLFSEYGIESIHLHIATIILLSIIIAMLCEVVRNKFKFDDVASGLKIVLQAMGRSMSGVVSLIVAAGVFAEGFKALGMLDAIVHMANQIGLGGFGMSVMFVIITTLVAIIAGSNGASFYPLIEMVPSVAKQLGVNPVMLVLPMHQASTIARPLSPVAGVVVALAGMLKVSPLELVKRCSVPCLLGLISHHLFVFVLSL